MKSFPILAALAAIGGGVDPFLPRMPSPRKRYVPQPVDHEAECRKFDDLDLLHRITGERRMVAVCGDHVVFVNGRGKCIRRDFRKALDWIRNADVVDPNYHVFSGSWGGES